MRVRELGSDDVEAVTRIASVLVPLGIEIDAIRSRLAQILALSGERIWVCELDEKIVGWIHAVRSYRITSEPFVEVVGLAVDSSHQRRGAGGYLMHEVVKWASSQRYGVRVRVNEERESAMGFYEKCGFTILKKQIVWQLVPAIK